jgi:hypothetical protein
VNFNELYLALSQARSTDRRSAADVQSAKLNECRSFWC